MLILLPALALLARILMAFSLAFLVPLAWAWSEDAPALREVWAASGALTLVSGWLLWLATRRHRRARVDWRISFWISRRHNASPASTRSGSPS